MTNQSLPRILAKLPTKWTLAIIGALICYALIQPLLNRGLGWNLPSLGQALGVAEEQDRGAKDVPGRSTAQADNLGSDADENSGGNILADNLEVSQSTVDSTANQDSTEPSAVVPSPKKEAAPEKKYSAKSTAKPPNSSGSNRQESSGSGQTAKPGTRPTERESLLYGILKDTGRENYISINGLRYTPGSEEGHRLKHLERHLQDIPNRPGKHGVFDGDMAQTLKWIDDAYERGMRGAKGIRKKQEENRTVLEVPFDKPIGYVGGRDGARSNHPPSKRLRLVIEGNRFITAFPF